MSQFDFAGSFMQGAQLGTRQYAELAAMAQNEAAMRQRQEQEAARMAQQQSQFDTRTALDRDQFAQQQVMQNAQLDRFDQQLTWDQEDRAREEAIRAQEQEYLGFARNWAKERARGAVGGGMGAFGGMEGGMQIPATIAAPSPQLPPETEAMLRMIDAADGDSLKQLLPYLDKADEHRRVQLLVQGIDKEQVGRMLTDPFHRAAYQTYKAANDPDNMMRVLAQDFAGRKQQEKAAAEVQQREQGAAALQRLRTNTSQNRDMDFAIAREAGLVNQEAVNISGRESPESYKKTPLYQLAQMDLELAEREFKATESDEARGRMRQAAKRLRDIVAAQVEGGAPPPPDDRERDAIDDAIDEALGGGAMPKN